MMMMIERNSALPTLRYVTMLALSARAFHPVIVSPRWGSGLFKRSSLVIERDCTPFHRAFSTSRITRANERMGLHTDSEPTSIRSRPWASRIPSGWESTARTWTCCRGPSLDSEGTQRVSSITTSSASTRPPFGNTSRRSRRSSMASKTSRARAASRFALQTFRRARSGRTRARRGTTCRRCGSPQGNAYFYQVEVLSDRIALGQALTMFHKESLFSIPKMRKLSEAFYAPSEDLTWWEKLGAHTSAATMYNLIDMAFTNEHFDLKPLPNFLTGWYYYYAAIILMDHIVSIYQALRHGIPNLSLIPMREADPSGLTTLKGYNPHLTIDDYDQHLR